MEALLDEAHEVVAHDRLELLVERERRGPGELLIALAWNPICIPIPICHWLAPSFVTINSRKFCIISWSRSDSTSALISFASAGWKRSSRLKRKAPALTSPLSANSRYLCRMASAADIEVRRPRSTTLIFR